MMNALGTNVCEHVILYSHVCVSPDAMCTDVGASSGRSDRSCRGRVFPSRPVCREQRGPGPHAGDQPAPHLALPRHAQSQSLRGLQLRAQHHRQTGLWAGDGVVCGVWCLVCQLPWTPSICA